MPRAKVGLYHCAHCNKTVKRSPLLRGAPLKQWIRSYCSSTGKDVRLQLVKLKR